MTAHFYPRRSAAGSNVPLPPSCTVCHSPVPGVAGVGADVDVILGVRHEVHPPEVGGLVGGLEGEVALLRLAGVSGRADDEAGHVGLAPLVLAGAVPHAEAVAGARCAP